MTIEPEGGTGKWFVFIWVSDGVERAGKIKVTMCPTCGLLVPHVSKELHAQWHRKLGKL